MKRALPDPRSLGAGVSELELQKGMTLSLQADVISPAFSEIRPGGQISQLCVFDDGPSAFR